MKEMSPNDLTVTTSGAAHGFIRSELALGLTSIFTLGRQNQGPHIEVEDGNASIAMQLHLLIANIILTLQINRALREQQSACS